MVYVFLSFILFITLAEQILIKVNKKNVYFAAHKKCLASHDNRLFSGDLSILTVCSRVQPAKLNKIGKFYLVAENSVMVYAVLCT